MELIEQHHKVWGRCPADPKESLRWIEKAGRICYASTDKITEGSAEPFVRKLIERDHLSVLEHGEACFAGIYEHSKYLTPIHDSACTVGNIRAWLEYFESIAVIDDWINSEECTYPQDVPVPIRRYTVEFVTNRAMLAEITRHRPASFSVESQRYVRYNNMQFIKPVGFDGWSSNTRNYFIDACHTAEDTYADMLRDGLTPQQARNILPNATATRIVMTASREEWEHVFQLRCHPSADPQMVALLTPVRDEMMALWESEK